MIPFGENWRGEAGPFFLPMTPSEELEGFFLRHGKELIHFGDNFDVFLAKDTLAKNLYFPSPIPPALTLNKSKRKLGQPAEDTFDWSSSKKGDEHKLSRAHSRYQIEKVSTWLVQDWN